MCACVCLHVRVHVCACHWVRTCVWSHTPLAHAPQTGTIPVLLSLVSSVVKDLAANPTASALPSSRITDMQVRAGPYDHMTIQLELFCC